MGPGWPGWSLTVDLSVVEARLAQAGCVAPDEEAAELARAAGGDPARLETLVGRRVAGEPLAWVTGEIRFGGLRVQVDPGVYVPRWETQILLEAALEVLPPDGAAVDLCTGSGAVAAAIARARPAARVVATDIDPAACRCARANRVDVYEGDLDAPLPDWMVGQVDVVTAVAPYVPTESMEYLPRDTLAHEPRRALDGGADGLSVVARVVAAAARLLRPGGALVVEIGGNQDAALAPVLAAAGFGAIEARYDEDGDLRAARAVLAVGGVRRGAVRAAF